MKRKVLCALLVVGAALVLTACGEAPVTSEADKPDAESGAAETTPERRVPVPGGGSFARVPPAGLQDMMEDKNFVLVNTHVPFEGNLPRTDLSIPYNEIGQNLDRLPGDKNARIVLYCKSGRMSAEAAEELVARGYEDVWDLGGGMDAWRRAGLPLEGV
jgi:rhodanese-related sulfurtransferase